jgi:hypothetical protein
MRYLLLVLCTTLLSLNSFARFISPRNPLDLLVLFLLFFILRSFALDESIALSKFLPDVRQGFEQWLIRFRNIGKNRVAFIFNIQNKLLFLRDKTPALLQLGGWRKLSHSTYKHFYCRHFVDCRRY